MLLQGSWLYTLSPCRHWAASCFWCSWWCCCKQLSKLHLMNSWRPAAVLLIEGWGILHCKKKVTNFPVPSRDVTNQALPSLDLLNYSLPGRVWLVTSLLGTGK
jgi:hypothetical protein